jgi:hypothetical protein
MYREVLRFMWRLRDFHSISLRRRMDSQSGLMVFTFMSLGIARREIPRIRLKEQEIIGIQPGSPMATMPVIFRFCFQITGMPG